LASYQAKLAELTRLDAAILAATVDDKVSTEDMMRDMGITFPIGYGLTQSELAEFDPWWASDDHGRYPQPMEFLVLRGGTVFGSMYASGPVGRMQVDEVIGSIEGRERRRALTVDRTNS
jgi:hypothetical protein|tara:strand:+ start:44 stop:400 length:357 start_codon:yes stop_codon:yes gene_type:complete